jgi:hypothetical protein
MKKSTTIKYTMNIAATIAILLTFASLTSYLTSMAYAQTNQTNQTTTGGATGTTPNQTGAQVTGPPETTVLNKTTVPAQQTNVTVNQTTEPVSPQALQPLENLTQSQTAVNLSGFENKTMVTPTGNATTTVVNKTTVPFNQTMVSAGEANQTTGQQSQQQGQGQQQQQQQGQQASNATSQSTAGGEGGGRQNNSQGGEKDPLSQMGESLGKMFGQQK